MKCLDDAQVQMLVDGEREAEGAAHVERCARCRERVEDARRRWTALDGWIADEAPMPGLVAARVIDSVQNGGPRGATQLRAGTGRMSFSHRAWWSTAAAAGLVLALVLIVPALRGRETVSAAGILAKSATHLAQVPQRGIEVREYELRLNGVPRELMRDQADGVYRIEQAIDHGARGRFRFTSYAADGRLLTSIAQEPSTRARVNVMRVEDRYYRFEFVMPESELPTLPEIERLHMEATINMMQASGQPLLREITANGRKAYLIEMPQVNAGSPKAVWDLTHARVLVDGSDFRVTEFDASGFFLNQPYSVSYKLLTQSIVEAVPPETFLVPRQSGEIVITGQGTANPAGDALFGALRELARYKTAQ